MTQLRTIMARIGVVAAVVIAYRIGTNIPAPGVDASALLEAAKAQSFSLWSLFAGGVLTRGSIFALGITPYITAAIIVQLVENVVPALKSLKDDGVAGEKKKQRIIKILGLVVLMIEAPTRAIALSKERGVLAEGSHIALIVIGFILGYLICMWLTEMVTRRGIGNGITVMMIASVASSAAPAIVAIQRIGGWKSSAMLVGMIVFVVCWTILAHMATRDLVVGSSRMRSLAPRTTANVSFKLMIVGVMPAIFASSIIGSLSTLVGRISTSAANAMANPASWLGASVMLIASVGLARMYVRLTFDPVEINNNIFKMSKFVPDVRPGWSTARVFHVTTASLAWASLIVFTPIILAAPVTAMLLDRPAPMIVGVSGAMVAAALVESVKQVRNMMTLDRVARVQEELDIAKELTDRLAAK